jgi:transcription antitermination factor NusG
MTIEDFKPGDAVFVMGGSFERCTGTVAGNDGKKVLVRLLIFGRVTDPVSIAPEIIRMRMPGDKDRRP